MMRFIENRPELGLLLAGFLVACGGRVDDGHGTPDDRASAGNASAGSSDGTAATGAGGRGGAGRTAGRGSAPSSNGGDGAPAGSDGNLASGGVRGSASGGESGVASSGATGAFPPGGADAGPSSLATEVWVGAVEHPITFPDSFYSVTTPQHVVMVLTPSADGISGSVVFGDQSPPEKATDPDAFYPPLTPDEYEIWDAVAQAPLNGFPYTLLDLRIDNGRLTASISVDELWRDWCALQTKTYPYPYADGGYQCTPYTAAIDNQGDVPIIGPLAKADLCNLRGPDWNVCECDQSACHTNLEVNLWRLDLQMKDALYEGEVSSTSVGGSETGAAGVWLPGVRLRRVK